MVDKVIIEDFNDKVVGAGVPWDINVTSPYAAITTDDNEAGTYVADGFTGNAVKLVCPNPGGPGNRAFLSVDGDDWPDVVRVPIGGVGCRFKLVVNRMVMYIGWRGGGSDDSPEIELVFNDQRPGRFPLDIYANPDIDDWEDQHYSMSLTQWFELRLMASGQWTLFGEGSVVIASGNFGQRLQSGGYFLMQAMAPGTDLNQPGQMLIDDIYVYPLIDGGDDGVRRTFAPSK